MNKNNKTRNIYISYKIFQYKCIVDTLKYKLNYYFYRRPNYGMVYRRENEIS